MSKPTNSPTITSLLLIVLMCGVATAIAADDLQLNWWTVAGGGGSSTDVNHVFRLSGTIGQPDASGAGAITGGSYTLTGGFWAASLPACTTFAPADFDQDCDVDNGDYTAFVTCVSGPDIARSPDCTNRDFDGDADVDQDDFGVFQRCYSGANAPADPNCAE